MWVFLVAALLLSQVACESSPSNQKTVAVTPKLFKSGQTVVLKNLSTQSTMNGEVGVLGDWDAEDNAFLISMKNSQKSFLVREQNLAPVESEQKVAATAVDKSSTNLHHIDESNLLQYKLKKESELEKPTTPAVRTKFIFVSTQSGEVLEPGKWYHKRHSKEDLTDVEYSHLSTEDQKLYVPVNNAADIQETQKEEDALYRLEVKAATQPRKTEESTWESLKSSVSSGWEQVRQTTAIDLPLGPINTETLEAINTKINPLSEGFAEEAKKAIEKEEAAARLARSPSDPPMQPPTFSKVFMETHQAEESMNGEEKKSAGVPHLSKQQFILATQDEKPTPVEPAEQPKPQSDTKQQTQTQTQGTQGTEQSESQPQQAIAGYTVTKCIEGEFLLPGEQCVRDGNGHHHVNFRSTVSGQPLEMGNWYHKQGDDVDVTRKEFEVLPRGEQSRFVRIDSAKDVQLVIAELRGRQSLAQRKESTALRGQSTTPTRSASSSEKPAKKTVTYLSDMSGTPLSLGRWYHKIGKNLDINAEEWLALPRTEQMKFVRIETEDDIRHIESEKWVHVQDAIASSAYGPFSALGSALANSIKSTADTVTGGVAQAARKQEDWYQNTKTKAIQTLPLILP